MIILRPPLKCDSLQHFSYCIGRPAFVDPTPTCGVASNGSIMRGQNVTLTYSMTYYYKSQEAKLQPGANVSASVSWESEAGTLLSSSSTNEIYSGGTVVGETLQVSVTKMASGAEIPPYNCTAAFKFIGKTDIYFTYATNSLAWTCVSSPVFTWCTYLSLIIFESTYHV